MKKIIILLIALTIINKAKSQSHQEIGSEISALKERINKLEKKQKVITAKFGKGIRILAPDSSFYMRAAFRFQSLFTNDWTVRNDRIGFIENHKPNFMIRRARLKFDGWAFSPKVKYKFELGISNRDISGGDSDEYSNASRIILDAYLVWNFWKGLSIIAGQKKLPGNRERVVSSANMQMVDRSLLNSRFNIDRGMGIQLKNKNKFGNNFVLKETFALSQGEGRNVTQGSFDGLSYTFHIEALPFGDFASKGDYVGADLKREQKPKLAIAAAYNFNDNSARTRGQNGSFMRDANGDLVGKTQHTVFADLMFKYRGFSVMSEYAYKTTNDGIPQVYDPTDLNSIVGTVYTGQAFNLQAGYLLKKDYELSGRFTMVLPQNTSVDNNQYEYTIGASKYFVGHKLKIQTDLAYRSITNSNDKIIFRLQTDIHF